MFTFCFLVDKILLDTQEQVSHFKWFTNRDAAAVSHLKKKMDPEWVSCEIFEHFWERYNLFSLLPVFLMLIDLFHSSHFVSKNVCETLKSEVWQWWNKCTLLFLVVLVKVYILSSLFGAFLSLHNVPLLINKCACGAQQLVLERVAALWFIAASICSSLNLLYLRFPQKNNFLHEGKCTVNQI